jgi:FtsH-binding integral membrane protein
MAIFATLIFFAFRNRSDPSAHKRFILIGTIALLIAAIARWPFAAFLGKPIAATLFSYVFLLLLVAYDLWSIRKVHRATLWAGVFLVLVQQIRVPIGQTAAWHAFAGWARSLAG